MVKIHGFLGISELLLSLEYKEVVPYLTMHVSCINIMLLCLCVYIDHPRYVEANTGCKHFDVHGGPENIPVSRSSFDAKVLQILVEVN